MFATWIPSYAHTYTGSVTVTTTKSNQTLETAYKAFQQNKLFEAKVSLLQQNVYPTDVFLKEHTETVLLAEQVEQLEQLAEQHKSAVPTLYMLVKRTSDVLLEGKSSTPAMERALLSYGFISESFRACLGPAIYRIMTGNKLDSSKSLAQHYNKADASKLLEFCLLKANTVNLMEGEVEPLCKILAEQLADVKLDTVKAICEGMPSIKVYVSSKTHTEIAKQLL